MTYGNIYELREFLKKHYFAFFQRITRKNL